MGLGQLAIATPLARHHRNEVQGLDICDPDANVPICVNPINVVIPNVPVGEGGGYFLERIILSVRLIMFVVLYFVFEYKDF